MIAVPSPSRIENTGIRRDFWRVPVVEVVGRAFTRNTSSDPDRRSSGSIDRYGQTANRLSRSNLPVAERSGDRPLPKPSTALLLSMDSLSAGGDHSDRDGRDAVRSVPTRQREAVRAAPRPWMLRYSRRLPASESWCFSWRSARARQRSRAAQLATPIPASMRR
jgi:hypothetical protein